jgi:enoyl-CoA hydratase
MSLWRASKPTIAKVHGYAIGGGSDIALCCDLLVMADDAKIGYPPTRVWGCPTTAMWTFRLGAARAKQVMFTGDPISGKQAADWGLANIAVPCRRARRAHERARRAHRRRAALAPGDAQARRQPDRAHRRPRAGADARDGVRRHHPPQPGGRLVPPPGAGRRLQGGGRVARQRRPIPEADEARRLAAELEKRIADRGSGG